MATLKLLRIADLKSMGVVSGWTQLRRLVENHGFPPGYLLGSTTRVWDVDAVEAWLQARRDASNPKAA